MEFIDFQISPFHLSVPSTEFPNISKTILKRDKVKIHMKTNSHHAISIPISNTIATTQFRIILQSFRASLQERYKKKERKEREREREREKEECNKRNSVQFNPLNDVTVQQ